MHHKGAWPINKYLIYIYIYIYISIYIYIYIYIYIQGCANSPPQGPVPEGLMGFKIHQVGLQNQENPSTWAPKSTKLASKIKKNQSWEVSGRVLGPSWAQEAPKTKIYPQNQKFYPPLGHPFWRPKASQNQFLRVPRGVNFLVHVLIASRSIF